MSLRVIMTFRREGDTWKIAQRNAAPITTARIGNRSRRAFDAVLEHYVSSGALPVTQCYDAIARLRSLPHGHSGRGRAALGDRWIAHSADIRTGVLLLLAGGLLAAWSSGIGSCRLAGH